MLRLFAALPIPPDIAPALSAMQRGVIGARWRPVENFHITLRFYGDLTRDTAGELDELLAEIDAPQMQLSLAGTGWFGRREPHSLHALVEPNAALSSLSGACERAARQLGLPADARPFKPHVTLAYLHHTLPEDLEPYTLRHAGFRAGPFWADRFHLYSSHLGNGPSRYHAETEYPLGPVKEAAE